jgi:anaerobic selenocysteine-containing dehydrogenase
MDPLPTWWSTRSTDAKTKEKYPLHALTQRPAAMYHSWGSQNAWLRQIHGENPLYVSKKIWSDYDFHVGDWAFLSSEHNQIKVPVVLMNALNDNTVWTWNAIGKRSGAWALDKNAPEAKKGFLLNHLIHELLPPKGDGLRWSNSDPITGQAAWYDLCVRIEKAPSGSKVSEPMIESQKSPVPLADKNIKYGHNFK